MTAGEELRPAADDGYPDVKDLVDLTCESWAETLILQVRGVSRGGLVLDAPFDLSGCAAVARAGGKGVVLWKAAGEVLQAPVDVQAAPDGRTETFVVRWTGPRVKCQRRSYVRAPHEAPVRLTSGPYSGGAITLDVSEGGLHCRTDTVTALRKGELLTVGFTLAGVEHACSAEIVRKLRTDLGLRFLDLPDRDADRIRAFVFAALQRARADQRR